jgi:ketosteroid isomerase-like protein
MNASETLVREFWRLMGTNDFRSVTSVLSHSFVMEWPQSRERIIGRIAYAKMNEEYPAKGPWRFVIGELVASEDTVVTTTAITDGHAKAIAVSFFTVKNGKITKLVEYWPQPYEPPSGRGHLIERMT